MAVAPARPIAADLLGAPARRPEQTVAGDDNGADVCGHTPIIANDMRAEIQAGRLRPGTRLPSETDLGYQYGVSRVTIRHAIKALSDEGLVEAVHGRGTFISDEPCSTSTP